MKDGPRRIIREKLREHQYRKGYARSFEGKEIEWDGENNVEHMWDQVKWAKFESAREVCGSVRLGGKNPKCVVKQCGKRCVKSRLLVRKCWELEMKMQ